MSLLLVGGWAVRKGRRRVATAVLSLGAGPLLYALVGILGARALGRGRFFSVPFGGERVTDGALLVSVMIWIGLVAGLVWRVTRRKAGAA